MDINNLKDSIDRCLEAKLVPFIQGSPGIGKSAIISEIAQKRNLKLIDVRLSQYDITDLNGLPKLNGSKAEFLTFDTFPIQGDELPEGKDGWLLFLDELNSAIRSVQCASYKLIQDRMVGNHLLHDNVYVVTAGNLITDNAVVIQMPTSLRSRMVNLTLEVDSDIWIKWALNNDVDCRIITFIKFKPDNLFLFNPSKNEKTYACPRTWVMLSKLIKSIKNLDNFYELIEGVVGSISKEFIKFTDLNGTLPTIEDILNGNATIPEKVGHKWMVVYHIIQNFKKVSDDDLEKICAYVNKLDSEYMVIFIKQIAEDDRKRILSNPKLVKYTYNELNA